MRAEWALAARISKERPVIYPAADKLDSMESKYALVIVAAKRARQIKDGARKLVDTRSANPLTVALEEIAQDAIIPVQVGEPEKLPTRMEATPVLTGLVATSMGDEEPIHEPTAAEIGALLTPTEDLAAYEPDAELSDDVMQSEDDVMEAEIDDAAEEGPYGLVVDGHELGIVSNDTAQDAEDMMVDDADSDEV
jgi:DNA-directed RNA polymerase subunit omega